MLQFPGPAAVVLLNSTGDVLSWSLLCFYTGIWIWADCNSGSCYLVLSVLDGCFVAWFLLPSLVPGKVRCCVLPSVRNFSAILLGVTTGLCG